MQPIKLEFIVKGDIDNELARIKLAIKGVGDESYTTFKRLLGSSTEAFNELSRTAQGQAVLLQRVIQELRQNEAAQEALLEKFEKGTVSSNDYAIAQARLSVQQAELKRQAADLNQQIEREIQLNGKVADSLEQKVSHVAMMKAEYSKLSEEERNNQEIGGKIVQHVKILNQEIEQINNRFRKEKESITYVSGSLQEKVALINKLREEYNRLTPAERDNEQIGGKLVKQVKQLNQEVENINNRFRKEKELVTYVSGSLQEKMAILSRLREEYARLNKEERENEKIGGSLLNRIRELDREIKKINGGLKETTTSSSNLTDALEQIPGPIGSGVSQFRQLLSVGKSFMSSGIGIFIAGLTTLFYGLKIAIEGSEQATVKFNSKSDYFKSIFSTHKKMLTEATASIYNLFTGDFDAANKNMQAFKNLQINQVLYAKLSEEATIKQNEINKLQERNNGLILANSAAIEQYRTQLMDVNKTFDQRKKIGQEILKLEKENANLKLEPLAENYANFISNSFDGYDNILRQFPKQIELANQYFDTLSKGGELTLGQQHDLINAINDITSGLDRGWNDEQKAKFRSYFTDALAVTKEYYSKSREVSTNLSNIIKQQANETAKANKKTALDKLQEEIKLYKEQYAILYAYERNMGKEAADEAFKDLKTKGGDFIAYLSNKINELKNKPNRTKDEDINLGYLQKTRKEATPKFDASAFKQSIEEKKRLYKEDIESYLQYIQRLRRLMDQDTSDTGTQKRIILDLEIKDVKEEQQKNLDDLLKNYQLFTVNMASLEKDYQRDMSRLGKAGKEATTDYDKKRYQDAMDARTDAYQVELATMQAENSNFSKVLFGDLEKLSKSALKKAISEARSFIKKWKQTAGTLAPEMEALLNKIEQGLNSAEKESTSKMASNLQEIAGCLQDCAGSVAEFNEELGESINTVGKLVGAIGQMASGNYLGAAFSVITSVVTSIAQSNQESIARAKKTEGDYWDAVNWKIERQIELMKELNNLSDDQANKSLNDQIEELTELLYNYDIKYKAKSGAQSQWIYKNVIGGYYEALKKGDELGIKVLGKMKDAAGDGIWNLLDGKGNVKFDDILNGLTTDELISLQGIPEVWRILPDEVQNYIKQLAEAVDKQKELEEYTKETYTNTNQRAITDSIAEGFLNGKRSAADFADDFKGLMRNAMIQSVKMKYLEEPLNKWYEQFAAASENGLTTDKIKDLQKDYDNIINNAAKEAETLEKITGLGMNNTISQQAKAGAFQSMSQDTGNELNGRFAAMQQHTSEISHNVENMMNILYISVNQLAAIEENTFFCRRLEMIEKVMISIQRDGLKVK